MGRVGTPEALDHQAGLFAGTNDLIETIGGRPPMTLEAFLEKHRKQDKEHIAGLLALIAEGQPPYLHCEIDPKAAAEWRAILDKVGRSLDAEIAGGHKVAEAIRRQLGRRPDLLAFCLQPSPDEEAEEGE